MVGVGRVARAVVGASCLPGAAGTGTQNDAFLLGSLRCGVYDESSARGPARRRHDAGLEMERAPPDRLARRTSPASCTVALRMEGRQVGIRLRVPDTGSTRVLGIAWLSYAWGPVEGRALRLRAVPAT